MPLVFAGILPHPPVLIPEIGKDHVKKLAKTQAAFKALEQDLYAAKPDSILIISPHGNVLNDAFNINLCSDYKANFKDFGDFGLELSFHSDYMSIQQIRAADESNDKVPIVLTSEENIDHGFSVPLYFLTKHLKSLPIIPVTYSNLDYQQHFEFGDFLYQQLSKINKRFAVIASADLSHKLSKTAPAGYLAKAKDFDKKIVEMLRKKDVDGFLKIDPAAVKEAEVCGIRSIIIFLGIIKEMNMKPELLSYESPFGVGYAVLSYKPV
ncbi:MAG: AmmeMemoRadiSam system protein B [Patescibacteria group bacterium]|nr:AmmeMemoRadiSam system protein B [Patescibacteria group bacterium]